MKNEKITDRYYKEAVKGLNDVVLADRDLWYNHVLNLPLHLQVVYTIAVFHRQVFNGGLHQYFFNSYGQFAYLTIEHLTLIKAFKASSILERATSEVNVENFSVAEFRIKIFNREKSRITDFDEQLFAFLNLLDKEYYELDEDLQQLFVDYLESR